MSWQPSLCQEVGDVVARVLAGAVLLCVVSNAVFLFYLPSRRSRGSDGRGKAQRSESRERADSRAFVKEGRRASLRASPTEQRSEAPSTERKRSAAGQRNGSGPNGWLDPTTARLEQRRKPMVLFLPEQQLPGRVSQAPGGSLWPPAPEKPGQAVAVPRHLHQAGLRKSGSFPSQRALTAGLPHGQ